MEEKEAIQDQEYARASCNNALIPEDGFLWKKYGQKFIKNISRNRSYFRCQNSSCQVKKKVEWCGDEAATYVRVTYEGAPHNHQPPLQYPLSQTTAELMANEYNLLSQFLSSSTTSTGN